MIVCDVISKDVLNLLWLLFHLVGLSANIYVGWALKKKWSSIGSFKLLLGTNVFSNVFALVVHLYLPINFIFRGVVERDWSNGSFLCIVLPPVANFALAASVLGLLAVVVEHYYRNIYKDEVSMRDAENTTVLVWAIACLITAPQLCQCGTTAPETHLDAGNCIQGWQLTDSGRFYEANRLILQYIIPFLTIANLCIKVQIYASGAKKCSKFRHFFSLIADVLTGVLIGAAVFFFPLRTLLSAQNHSFVLPSPDVSSANQILEFFAVFCCITIPFKLLEFLNNEELNAALEKSKMRKYKTTKEIVTEKLSEEKQSELLISLVNEEPFRLKNEIIV